PPATTSAPRPSDVPREWNPLSLPASKPENETSAPHSAQCRDSVVGAPVRDNRGILVAHRPHRRPHHVHLAHGERPEGASLYIGVDREPGLAAPYSPPLDADPRRCRRGGDLAVGGDIGG